MRRVATAVALTVAAAGVVAFAVSRRDSIHRTPPGDGEQAWQAVTVNVAPEEVSPERRLPEPLAELGDSIEVDRRPAPGERGTELRVRPREDGTGALRLDGPADVHRYLRQALREAKQILEAGEVLQGPEPATARRTLRNSPLRVAERRAKREGLL